MLSFWHEFPVILNRFYIFFGRRFSYAFLDMFSSLSAPKWLPKGSPSRHKIWRKIKNLFSSSIDTFQIPFWHHFGCILAAIWKVLGAFWSPFAVDVGNYGSQLGHILATIDSHVASSDPTHWISLFVIRATSGKSVDGEELITWIAGWMDFWCWRYSKPVRPGGSWLAWPSTIFPTSFDMDFPEHFVMDFV